MNFITESFNKQYIIFYLSFTQEFQRGPEYDAFEHKRFQYVSIHAISP